MAASAFGRAASLAGHCVLVSGLIDEQTEAEARAAGIEAVLPKQWLVERLGPCLAALDRVEPGPELRTAQPSPEMS